MNKMLPVMSLTNKDNINIDDTILLKKLFNNPNIGLILMSYDRKNIKSYVDGFNIKETEFGNKIIAPVTALDEVVFRNIEEKLTCEQAGVMMTLNMCIAYVDEMADFLQDTVTPHSISMFEDCGKEISALKKEAHHIGRLLLEKSKPKSKDQKNAIH